MSPKSVRSRSTKTNQSICKAEGLMRLTLKTRSWHKKYKKSFAVQETQSITHPTKNTPNTWKSFNTWSRLKRKCRLLSSTWLIRLLSEKENLIQTDLSFPDEIPLLGRIRHSWETKMKLSKKQSPSMMQKCGKSRFLKIKNKSKSLVKSSLAQIKKTKVWQTLNSFPYPISKPISS